MSSGVVSALHPTVRFLRSRCVLSHMHGRLEPHAPTREMHGLQPVVHTPYRKIAGARRTDDAAFFFQRPQHAMRMYSQRRPRGPHRRPRPLQVRSVRIGLQQHLRPPPSGGAGCRLFALFCPMPDGLPAGQHLSRAPVHVPPPTLHGHHRIPKLPLPLLQQGVLRPNVPGLLDAW